MILQIPLEHSNKFAEFFKDFDSNLEKLGILSYGISISTLEEVFLKVGHIDDDPISE
jgi:ATP-binding cassette, subfamily A (ABC1), member 3